MEISLWLDSYDDIFSDFDSRNYQKRRISEDFLDELKASIKYRNDKQEALVLLLPKELRKAEIEREIISGLKEQFHSRYDTYANKMRKISRKGYALVIAGIVTMLVDSYISFKGYRSYPMTILHVLLEPAGWFLIWNGLDSLLYDYRTVAKDVSFYNAARHMNVHFRDF
ncbi:MAG: hypothetical protein P4L41_08730 [Flavipsychrobacter sp.]|nr:hypothetical protein [Flavipsychrobacter sp.]